MAEGDKQPPGCWSVLLNVVLLATAVVGFSTAVVQWQAREDAEVTVEDQSTSVGQLQQDLATANSKIVEQRGTIADLQQRIEALGGDPGDSEDGDGGVTVRNSSQGVMLRPDSGVDLDSRTPNWGVNLSSSYQDIKLFDLNDGQYLGPYASAEIASVDVSGYAACAGATAYSDEDIALDDLEVGALLCVATGEERYAQITVTTVGRDSVSFDATAWDPQYS